MASVRTLDDLKLLLKIAEDKFTRGSHALYSHVVCVFPEKENVPVQLVDLVTDQALVVSVGFELLFARIKGVCDDNRDVDWRPVHFDDDNDPGCNYAIYTVKLSCGISYQLNFVEVNL